MGELRKVKSIPAVIARRAAENYTVDEKGCWISTYRANPNGYHVLSQKPHGENSSIYLAHRAAYTFHNGPILGQLVVDHMCHNRGCVNPEHLRTLPRHENARRHLGKPDFPLGQCPNGHPLSEQRYREKGRTAGLGYCGTCQKVQNDRTTTMRSALYNLELAYGLGGHETKRNYPHRMHLRQERVDAVRDARLNAATGDPSTFAASESASPAGES